jgi:hypothetical protein
MMLHAQLLESERRINSALIIGFDAAPVRAISKIAHDAEAEDFPRSYCPFSSLDNNNEIPS